MMKNKITGWIWECEWEIYVAWSQGTCTDMDEVRPIPTKNELLTKHGNGDGQCSCEEGGHKPIKITIEKR